LKEKKIFFFICLLYVLGQKTVLKHTTFAFFIFFVVQKTNYFQAPDMEITTIIAILVPDSMSFI